MDNDEAAAEEAWRQWCLDVERFLAWCDEDHDD